MVCYDIMTSLAANTTINQLLIDFGIIFFVGANTFLGWRYGLVRRLFVLVGLYAAAFAASHIGSGVGSIFHTAALYQSGIGYLVMFLIIAFAFEMLGFLYSDKIRGIAEFAFDDWTGAAAGLLIGILECGYLVLIALSIGSVSIFANAGVPVDHAQLDQTIRSSLLGGAIVFVEPAVRALLGPVLQLTAGGYLTLN